MRRSWWKESRRQYLKDALIVFHRERLKKNKTAVCLENEDILGKLKNESLLGRKGILYREATLITVLLRMCLRHFTLVLQ